MSQCDQLITRPSLPWILLIGNWK